MRARGGLVVAVLLIVLCWCCLLCLGLDGDGSSSSSTTKSTSKKKAGKKREQTNTAHDIPRKTAPPTDFVRIPPFKKGSREEEDKNVHCPLLFTPLPRTHSPHSLAFYLTTLSVLNVVGWDCTHSYGDGVEFSFKVE